MNVEKQVALLYCGVNALLAKLPLNKIKEFEKEFIHSLETMYQNEVLDVIRDGEINSDVTNIIENVAEEVIHRIMQPVG